VFVLNFADTPRIDVPLTSDPAVLEAGIARVDAIGGTALRDAVAMGETYLEQHASRDRRALVVVTDGNDNASATTMDEIQKRAEVNDIVVYGVGLFGEPSSSGARLGRRELEQMTERTGGIGYYPAGIDQIEAVALELARQIRNQYTLAYAPVNQRLDGSYRSIRVEAVGPVRGERLEVRTRAGYRAVPGLRP
jgi:VWFA-related protein